jgi:hypothetical protein
VEEVADVDEVDGVGSVEPVVFWVVYFEYEVWRDPGIDIILNVYFQD